MAAEAGGPVRRGEVAALDAEALEVAAGAATLVAQLGAAHAALARSVRPRTEAKAPMNLAALDAPRKTSHGWNVTPFGRPGKPMGADSQHAHDRARSVRPWAR